jgi:anhydro-N-acetylmuramic acid kinase
LQTRWIIGLASGCNAEEVDAALLAVEGTGLEMRVNLVEVLHQPYGADLRDLMRRVATAATCEVRHISLLHRLLGETFASAARSVADRASMSLQNVQCIGCPGHKLWHDVEGRFPSTLAVGMAAVVAERTGITTVSDFRYRDVAAGGRLHPFPRHSRNPRRDPPRRRGPSHLFAGGRIIARSRGFRSRSV